MHSSRAQTLGSVAAVVPTLDRHADLATCLDAIAAQSRPADFTVVVDNGRTAEVAAVLDGREDLVHVTPDENLGAPGGFDRGMREAFTRGAGWAWLVDDDAVPDAAALAE